MSTPPKPPDVRVKDAEDPLDVFERLILRGHEILHMCGWNGKEFTAFQPRGVEATRFRTEALMLMRTCFGEDSKRYRDMKTCSLQDKPIDVAGIVHVLEGAQQAYTRESMFNVPAQLLLELGEDLIELAEVLANAGHRRQAARQCVRVLTTRLRRLARDVGDMDDAAEPTVIADGLRATDKLAAADHRRIAACLQIGRDLDGPRADAIPDAELDEAVQWVKDFVLRTR